MKSRIRPGNRLTLPTELWEAAREQMLVSDLAPLFGLPRPNRVTAALDLELEHCDELR